MSQPSIMDANIFTHFFYVFSSSTCKSQPQDTVQRVVCLTGKPKLPVNSVNVCGQLTENRELQRERTSLNKRGKWAAELIPKVWSFFLVLL